jgi:hypothetical protein
MHRLATSEFTEISRYAGGDPLDSEILSKASPDELVHWIDQMITTLYKYRNQVKENSDDLLDSFVKAWEAQARLEADAVVPDDSHNLPSAGNSMATAFFGERLATRMRAMGGDSKSDDKFRYSRGPGRT